MALELLPLILITAVLSSILTLAGLYVGVRWFVKTRFNAISEALAEEFEQKLRTAFEETGKELVPEFRAELEQGFQAAAEDVLPEFRAQMKEGFHQAGQELLPELRNEVREGFKDAMVQTLSGELVPQTARSVARKGNSLLDNGLSRLLGNKKRN